MNGSKSLIDKIDESLSSIKESEMTLLLVIIFVFIGFISYSYVFPVTDKKLKTTKRNLITLNNKIKTEKRYLRSITRNGDERYFIKKAKNEIQNSKIQLSETIKINDYIDNKLRELSYIIFNNKNWAKFLDKVSLIAQKNHVKIKVIKNKINKPTIQKIEQILNLKVRFSGRFQNVMKFINQIEESRLVVDIYKMTLKGDTAGVSGVINIGVWGMKY